MKAGVTGIFASGKGTVCAMFEKLGGVVIDTDIVARDVVAPGSEGLHQIRQTFGNRYVAGDGTLRRREFARDIFSDAEKVKLLNSITHPLILKEVQRLTAGDELYVVNTPLLFESGFDSYMDTTIVVVADEKDVIQRGIDRDGISAEEIKERLKYQIPLNEKKKMADHIIDNSGSLEETERQVKELWNIFRTRIHG